MAALAAFDDFINRIGGNFYLNQPIWGEIQSTTTAAIAGTGSGTGQRCGETKAMPSLPTGVTGYIPTMVEIYNSAGQVGTLFCKAVNLGTFDIGNTTTGTFTDGSAMPTATILGTASASLSSAVLVEVTTATSGTQTSVTVTYKNQAGTGSQTTSFTPVTSAVARSVSSLSLGGTDWGVQDITAVARSASSGPTGVLKFWGIIPISYFACGTNVTTQDNLLSCGVNILRLAASDTLETFVFGSTATKNVTGRLYVVGDS